MTTRSRDVTTPRVATQWASCVTTTSRSSIQRPNLMKVAVVVSESFPLYHWSPTSRRKAIIRRGFTPGSWSTDRLWKPPVICFANDPELAWTLSGDTPRGRQVDSWDLWMIRTDALDGYEEIVDYYPNSRETYVKEYRVYQRVMKRDIFYVGTRTQAGQRG